MKKQSYLTAAGILAVVALIGAGCSDTTTNRPMIASSEPQIEITGEKDHIQEDTNTSQEKTFAAVSNIREKQFYVAQQTNFATTVFIEDPHSYERTELFTFERTNTWPDQENYANTFPSAIDYSPALNQFAYVHLDELYTYDVASGTTTTLLEKTGVTGQIDGIDILKWSIDGLPERPLGIKAVEYSPDSSKLRIESWLWEGQGHSVMDLSTQTITFMENSLSPHFDWSDQSDDALTYIPYGTLPPVPGLFVATDDAYSETVHVYAQEAGLSVTSAVWLEDNTIVMAYQDLTHIEDDWHRHYVDEKEYHLAHINADGTFIKKVATYDRKVTVHIGEGMKAYFSHEAIEGTSSDKSFAVVDATDYLIRPLGGGPEMDIQHVDPATGMLVYISAVESSATEATQNIHIYGSDGELLYQPASPSTGELIFLGWKQ